MAKHDLAKLKEETQFQRLIAPVRCGSCGKPLTKRSIAAYRKREFPYDGAVELEPVCSQCLKKVKS